MYSIHHGPMLLFCALSAVYNSNIHDKQDLTSKMMLMLSNVNL